jgi:transposase-like protein
MKARIALEAIKEQKTIQEIASHYGVHPSQVTNWKRQAIQGAHSTGDAKPIRDLMRDLERVNGGQA